MRGGVYVRRLLIRKTDADAPDAICTVAAQESQNAEVSEILKTTNHVRLRRLARDGVLANWCSRSVYVNKARTSVRKTPHEWRLRLSSF